ncbi:MAG: glucuronate isomerase, partial [Kiritimatiellae bacterium]|nr:glucuronate isomerase [Kiritimatiellia bacterium]
MKRQVLCGVVLAIAGTAAASVFDDARLWWKFDRDINGDGNVQTNEVRDVRHWGGTNANAYARAHVVPNAMGDPFGGPQWQNASVYLPARGVTVQSPCMDFPIVTNVSVNASGDTIYSAWLTRLDVPRAAISGSSTVIARIRPQLHYGALRNANTRMYGVLGADTGYDCINTPDTAQALVRLLDSLEEENLLPKTILYSLNPNDNAVLTTAMGCFQHAGTRN